jgi:hypothetical protein
MESEDRAAAQTQLAALRADRVALAARAVQPWWWDVALGLLAFTFLGSYAVLDWWGIALCGLVFFAGIYGLVAFYRRRTGLWLSADRPGVQPLLRFWLACCIGWAVVAVLHMQFDLPELLLGVSAVCGVAAGWLSRRSGQLFVAELHAEL